MKRSPIHPISKKRAAENRLRAKLRPQVVGGPCQVRLPVCTGRATDWHERLTRARGGSITDLSNAIGCCRECHSWLTEHPQEAHEMGFMSHAWEVLDERHSPSL